MSLIRNHCSWYLSAKVQRFCREFFSRYHFNYFDYSRFYRDGTVVTLYSNREYVDFFSTDPVYNQGPTQLLPPGAHLWASYIDSEFLMRASKHFQHSHGITLQEEFKDYLELANFAASPENAQVNYFYTNKLHVLKQFVEYFRDGAGKMLREVEHNRIDLSIQATPVDSPVKDAVDKIVVASEIGDK